MSKGRAQNMPNKYAKMFGSIKIKRGTLDGSGEVVNPDTIKLVQWDAAPPCTDENCPCYEICDYKDRRGRCKVFVYFMHACAQIYMDNLSYVNRQDKRMSYIAESQWRDIGLLLMPMWGDVCRLNIEITGATSLMYHDHKGNLKKNPLLKERRDTILTIKKLEKMCDISDQLQRKMVALPEPKFSSTEDYEDYYEQLESSDGPPIKDPAKKIVKRKAD